MPETSDEYMKFGQQKVERQLDSIKQMEEPPMSVSGSQVCNK